MQTVDWEGAVNQQLSALHHNLEEYPHHLALNIGEVQITFPLAEIEPGRNPAEWFARTHSGGTLHEPGLVAWIVSLAGHYADRHVRFYDIGAQYGYFGALAAQLFAQRTVTLVEANPYSAKYAGLVMRANRINDVTVRHALVAAKRGTGHFAIDGFQFTPDVAQAHTYQIDTVTLGDLLVPPERNKIDILKIDVEGFQAEFLPPATNMLIERGAVLLLELDRPEKMARFGRSNSDLVQPFLDREYSLFWSEHRDPSARIEPLTALASEHERNSLAVLIPPC